MDRRSAAHNYAERAWRVLPVEPRGKRPLGRLAPHGYRNATINHDLIEEWWRAEPEANVGLATGLAFDVIDVDGPDGYEALTVEMPEDGGHIWGPTSITGGGGWHVYVGPTGRGNRNRLVPHVDWRGLGGHVVAPPSLHASGQIYAWPDWLDSDRCGPDGPIVPAPRWVIDLLDRRPPDWRLQQTGTDEHQPPKHGWSYARVALRDECAQVANSQHGARNATLNIAAFKVATLIASNLLDPDAARQLLLAAARCGLPEAEARRTVASAFQAGFASPRQALP